VHSPLAIFHRQTAQPLNFDRFDRFDRNNAVALTGRWCATAWRPWRR